MKRDKAVDAALALLADAICECGHLESEHYFAKGDSMATWKACDRTCRCREFRPVAFRVERAS